MRAKKISEFINEPWREVGLNAMKRGQDICERNGIPTPEGYMAMCVGLCDIIREIKEDKKEAKMIGDTPRTDEQEHFIDSDRGITDSGLARELERELNAANERIKRLEEAGDRMFRLLEHDGFESVGQNMWKQAKESKP